MTVNEKMTELADAIREVTGGTNPLTLDDMIRDIKAVGTVGITNTAEGIQIRLLDSDHRYLRGLNLYGKTTQNGTPTPDSPVELKSVGNGGDITVVTCVKNLFAGAEPGSVSASGEEFTSENDAARRTPYISCKPGEQFAISKAVEFTGTGENAMMRCFNEDKVFVKSITALSYNAYSNVVTIPDGVSFFRFVQFGYGKYQNVNLQIERGNTVTEYDGFGQTMTVSTTNGLPGIPVSVGGNYTDASGQQWICDEIDFARGKYIKRLGKIESYASEEIIGAYMSTTGVLSTGATVLYQLEEAIETNLTAEENTAYATLCTNYPSTTIYNDDDAWMKVKYVADTKLYIDNQTAALAEAIVNN